MKDFDNEMFVIWSLFGTLVLFLSAFVGSVIYEVMR